MEAVNKNKLRDTRVRDWAETVRMAKPIMRIFILNMYTHNNIYILYILYVVTLEPSPPRLAMCDASRRCRFLSFPLNFFPPKSFPV